MKLHALWFVGWMAFGLMWAGVRAEDPAPAGGVTLLGTLEEWLYPDAKFGGAEISDGDNRTLISAKCQAVLTTSDPVEKVAKYYTEKFVSGPAELGQTVPVSQTVSEQSDSEGRPVELRVMVVTRAKSSTTLVISRAKGEDRTHIAWSHYMHLGDLK